MFLDRRGYIGVSLIWILMVMIIAFILIGAVNYSIYSYQSMIIGRGIGYAVCAAVQEIDKESSMEGLAKSFDEDSGLINTEGIYIDMDSAEGVFYRIFEANTGIRRDMAEENLTLVSVYPQDGGINYTVRRKQNEKSGTLDEPEDLEDAINQMLGYGEIDGDYTIFVNNNPKTNEFTVRPYYMAVLKDYGIQGLLSLKKMTYVGFKAGRINRRGQEESQ